MKAEVSFFDGTEEILNFELSSVATDAEIELAMRCLQSTALEPYEVRECLTGTRSELKISKQLNAVDQSRTFTCGSNPHVVAKVWGD